MMAAIWPIMAAYGRRMAYIVANIGFGCCTIARIRPLDAVRWHASGLCMLYDGFPVEYLV